ncbi:MAG: PilZ domain-containing protein [Planctomycetota bacterium]
MTSQNTIPPSQQTIRLISKIQSEYIRQIRERRECHRQFISLMAVIEDPESNSSVDAITRDLSSSGISLITNQSLDLDTQAVLAIRLARSTDRIEATCRWCHAMGSLFISGWQFESGNE